MSDTDENVTHIDFTKGRARKTESPAQNTKPVREPANATKLLVFKHMIADSVVMLRFVTSADGVIVPEALKHDMVQALKFSHRFGVPDFGYDDVGVRASLSFGGTNVFCSVPWSAVFSFTCEKTNETVVWPAWTPRPKDKS